MAAEPFKGGNSMVDPTQTTFRQLGGGGMGNIVKSESDFRVQKEKRDTAYREGTINIFTNYLLKKFPFLMKFQVEGKVLYIPANSLSTEEIEQILAQMDSLRVMDMKSTGGDIFNAFVYDVDFKEELRDLDKLYGRGTTEEYIDELVKLFDQLREFLIVEKLGTTHNPIFEYVVHNSSFSIEKTVIGYRVVLELENWSGYEDETGESKDLNVHQNLEDIILDIDDFENISERKNLLLGVLNGLIPVAKALDFIRAQGYQHFDVKPKNIFVRALNDENGVAYLSYVLGDFGLSLLPRHPGDNDAGGTREYIAPELQTQYISTKDVIKADVYSFAVTLFEIICGELPNIISQDSSEKPKKFMTTYKGNFISVPTTLNPTPEQQQRLLARGVADRDNIVDVLSVVAKGMSMSPDFRYDSCEEMVKDLIQKIEGTVLLVEAA